MTAIPLQSLSKWCLRVAPVSLLLLPLPALAKQTEPAIVPPPIAVSVPVEQKSLSKSVAGTLEPEWLLAVPPDATAAMRNGAERSLPSVTVVSPSANPLPLVSSAPESKPAEAPSPATESPKPVETPAEPQKPAEESAEPSPDAAELPIESTDAPPTRTPEEQARWQKLAEADRLYKSGNIAEAEKRYREAKSVFGEGLSAPQLPPPIYDPTQLSPAGRVYWREAEAGKDLNLETRIFVPLRLLVEKQPEFIPAHIVLAEELEKQEKREDALRVLEQASSLYPNEPDLLRVRIKALARAEQWMEASIAARQFALLNPEHPAAAEFTTAANENLDRYRAKLRSRLTGNVIANVITGAAGYALTGNLFGPLSAVQSTILLMQGEQAIGDRFVRQAQRRLPLVKDETVLNYVNRIGQKLTQTAGRDDFRYEFFVILDDDLNAFALPGGKIFINAGAITKANSEAELAGLLAHEISHSVLSHGFTLVTKGNLTANVLVLIPYAGGLAANLAVLSYSREMEQQADVLGTRLLAASGYAADGLRNLMVTLDKQDKRGPTIAFLSTHPGTGDRIRYLESLVLRGSYNRFAYEGVEEHAQIQERVRKLLQAELTRRKNRENRNDRREPRQEK